VAGRAQSADRVDGRVQVTEHRQQARRRRRVENGGERIEHLHVATALARLGAGSTSFTSEIDTAGKFFTNRRNHMKNQPKLPAMMPQSAHVGLYPCVTQGSNGSPARWMAMVTKRASHMPTVQKIEVTDSHGIVVRTYLHQKRRGRKALHTFI